MKFGNRKSNNPDGYDSLEEIAHLEWVPTDHKTLAAMARMSVRTWMWGRGEDPEASWLTRHQRLTRAGVLISLIAQPLAGEVFLGGHWEATTHADERSRAAAFQRCETVAKKEDFVAGSLGGFVRLDSLTKQEQADCGYSDISYYVDTTPQLDSIPGGGKILIPAGKPSVELPTTSDLKAKYARAMSNTKQTQYTERIIGASTGLMSDFLMISGLGWLVKRKRSKESEEANA